MIKKYSKGFTLIELMTAVSIISILSSLVVASTQNARASATLNAAKQFDATTYRGYGADAFAYWKMDTLTGSGGNVIRDETGNGNDLMSNDGPVGTAVPTPTSGVYTGSTALQFGYDDAFHAYTTSVSPAMAQMNLTGGSITVWVRPTTPLGTENIIGSDGIETSCVGSSDKLFLQIVGGSTFSYTRGMTATGNIQFGTPTLNKWSQIGLSWSGGSPLSQATMKAYYNGQYVKSASYTLDTLANETLGCLTIGRNGTNDGHGNPASPGKPFVGAIDELHVYSNQLSDAEMKARYLAERDTLPTLAEK